MRALSYLLFVGVVCTAALLLATAVSEAVVVPFERVSAQLEASRRGDR